MKIIIPISQIIGVQNSVLYAIKWENMLDITLLFSRISLSVGETNIISAKLYFLKTLVVAHILMVACAMLFSELPGLLLKTEIPGLHPRGPDPDSQGNNPWNLFKASPQGSSYSDEEEKFFWEKTNKQKNKA